MCFVLNYKNTKIENPENSANPRTKSEFCNLTRTPLREEMDLQSARMKRLEKMQDFSERLLAMILDEKDSLQEEMIQEKKTNADVDTDAPLKTAVQILEEKKQKRQVTMEREEYQREGLWICRLIVNGKGFESIAPRKKDAYQHCAVSALEHLKL